MRRDLAIALCASLLNPAPALLGMGWLQVDLRGLRVPVPHDSGCARERRLALRQRLRREEALTGAAALAITAEIQLLELREAADSLHDLLYSDSLCNITGCASRPRAA
jgi:hypothetical protein